MSGPKTTFDFENTGKTPITLILEPEACEFELPQGGKVTVTIPAGESNLQMTHAVGPTGEILVSFWSEHGYGYKITCDGKDVWDCF